MSICERFAKPEVVSAGLPEGICCPVCRGELHVFEGTLRCRGAHCGAEFPVCRDVPILLHESQSVFSVRDFLENERTYFKRAPSRLRGLLSGCLPNFSRNLAAPRVLGRMRELLLARSRSPRVLVVGAGRIGPGLDQLLDDPAIEVVESDVDLTPRVTLVCDAHALPFRDGAFDGVVAEAVLEHVLDPSQCVAEMHRVLRDGGLVYADTPFIAQVHAREFDFTRFTRLGHRRLFRHFGEIDAGMSGGPGAALAWTVRYYLMSFSRRRAWRALASGATRLGLFWLKYLDSFLLRSPAAMDAAMAFYFLGQKQDQPLSDRDLLTSYQGGF